MGVPGCIKQLTPVPFGWKNRRLGPSDFKLNHYLAAMKRLAALILIAFLPAIGSFHGVSVKHLHRYLNEFSFRFNQASAKVFLR
jgi:transposase-like protein